MRRHRWQSPPPEVKASGFVQAPGSLVACPVALLSFVTCPWQWSIYQLAFEQAQAQARPSLLERALVTVLN